MIPIIISEVFVFKNLTKEADAPVEQYKTRILDITKIKKGAFKAHFKVAISIVDYIR